MSPKVKEAVVAVSVILAVSGFIALFVSYENAVQMQERQSEDVDVADIIARMDIAIQQAYGSWSLKFEEEGAEYYGKALVAWAELRTHYSEDDAHREFWNIRQKAMRPFEDDVFIKLRIQAAERMMLNGVQLELLRMEDNDAGD